MSELANLFDALPDASLGEVFTELLNRPGIRVERIVSKGQVSEPDFWYEQSEHEWLIVLQGSAQLSYETGVSQALRVGDHCLIEAGVKHRVSYTSENPECIWLAVFFST